MRVSPLRRASGLLVVMAMLVSSASVNLAHAKASGEGEVAVGHPGVIAGGVTEAEFTVANRCEKDPSWNGLDGWVADLGYVTTNGMTLKVNATTQFPVRPTYVYASFYSSACSMTRYVVKSSPYTTYVPIGTRWIVIGFLTGTDISFKWETCNAPC